MPLRDNQQQNIFARVIWDAMNFRRLFLFEIYSFMGVYTLGNILFNLIKTETPSEFKNLLLSSYHRLRIENHTNNGKPWTDADGKRTNLRTATVTFYIWTRSGFGIRQPFLEKSVWLCFPLSHHEANTKCCYGNSEKLIVIVRCTTNENLIKIKIN